MCGGNHHQTCPKDKKYVKEQRLYATLIVLTGVTMITVAILFAPIKKREVESHNKIVESTHYH